MKRLLLACALVLALAAPASALVRLDEGRRQILGIQLLQDANDPKSYFYVPSYPRLATNPDGSFQFLCIKYVDPKGKASSGLFHALVEFTLPPEFVTQLEKELQKQVPGARLAGPVQLVPSGAKEGEDPGSFEIISAILKNTGEGGLTRQLVTSGKAPVTPGSRAAVAALLTQEGATLLWDSLTSSTSDVSVGINATYEALVTSFDARVTAEMSTIYDHFSKLDNKQEGFKKRQVRDIIDELRRKGDIKVEVLDRSRALDIPTGSMQGLVDSITSKLTELMFDSKTGLSADPPQEVAVEKGQIQGRQSRGFLHRLISGTGNQAYYSDDQLVLKRRSDIRRNVFSVVLTKNSTVKVPVHTAGNLRGLYEAHKADPRYFRIVGGVDAAFQRRPLHFQVDGEYVSGFQDAINFVAVSIRKKYADAANPDFTETIRFGQEMVKDGRLLLETAYPRLGEADANFLQYEYQVVWSFRGRDSVRVPAEPNRWIRTMDPAVSLTPPLEKRVIDIDADRGRFADRGIASANVIFEYALLGQPKQTRATLRAADTASANTVTLFADREAPVKARVTWYFKDGRQVVKEMPAESYMSLVPPEG